MTSLNSLAFVGLGVMGYPMAGHLQTAGYSVTVYNRTKNKAEQWQTQYGGHTAATPAAAAKNARMVFTCVGNDDDLRSVIYGADGILAGLAEGGYIIDHSTTSAEVARELAVVCADKGCFFMDAPISGGQQGAENGALTIMCGAEEEVFAAAEPILQHYAKAVNHMGPAGAGQLTKMCNQIAVAGAVQGLAESMLFAEQAGLDVAKAVAVMSAGAASSWQMVNRHQTMIAGDYDHGFAVDWMLKDLAICLTEAQRNGAEVPVTTIINNYYKEISAMGGGRWDTSSLLKRLQNIVASKQEH